MFDLITGYNNGTLIIMPHPEGNISALCKDNSGGNPKGWVFADVHIYQQEGEEYVNHIRRGALMGTHEDATAFLNMCREIGLTVDSRGMGVYVPLSNGMNRYGKDSAGGVMTDYDMNELAYCRYDLPTKEILMQCQAPTEQDLHQDYEPYGSTETETTQEYEPYHTNQFADDDIPF